MSPGYRGRGRGGAPRGGRSGRGGPARGLFENGVWNCDCNPRLPAVHFEVKKEGPNKGKWFRTCQKQSDDKNRCGFFLWDNDAHSREAAALSNNSRTEPGRESPTTPSKRQASPPPPYTPSTDVDGRSRKRLRSRTDSDEFGLGQTDSAFQNELNEVMEQVETPSKVARTSEFATPAARRTLPWQMGESSRTSAIGLHTPQTADRDNPFNSRLLGSGSLSTPSRINKPNDETHQPGTPSSAIETPTHNRFRNPATDDVIKDVFHLLQDRNIHLDTDGEANLRYILSKHAKTAEGYKRGRDVIRTTVKAKDAKITELTYRISTLEAELEAEKAVVKHLQWEAGSQPDTT